jgi:hypothetical protein
MSELNLADIKKGSSAAKTTCFPLISDSGFLFLTKPTLLSRV